MLLKFVKDDDFVNYKKCSLFLGTVTCSWKCCHEACLSESICQNYPWFKQNNVNLSDEEIVKRYMSDPLEEAVVFGGLEPFDQFQELYNFIQMFRRITDDDVVIYTGYYQEEIESKINLLSEYKNIIIKFGRFIPNQKQHYDDVLGVSLASLNQYAKKIS